jgi:hypothetical protein
MFITSVLVAGASMVVLDNISGRLDSAPLARVLTVDIWEDRLLGVRRQVRRLNRAVWVATGKPGVAVAGGGARRSEDTGRPVRIRLAAGARGCRTLTNESDEVLARDSTWASQSPG